MIDAGSMSVLRAFFLLFCLLFPRRGGNYNNTSNAGLGYVNSNNSRGNSNVNYGVRSALPSQL